jgi:hypothetical protein
MRVLLPEFGGAVSISLDGEKAASTVFAIFSHFTASIYASQ